MGTLGNLFQEVIIYHLTRVIKLTLFTFFYIMTKYYNSNWQIDEKIMKTKYKLIVKESGNYTSDSLSSLLWTVFKHRCEHLFKGEGWRD